MGGTSYLYEIHAKIILISLTRGGETRPQTKDIRRRNRMSNPVINSAWLDTHDWMLRSSNDGVTHNGFKWKRKWAWNKCPDWNPEPVCGGGFHGLAPGAISAGFFYQRLELHETRGERVIVEEHGLKIKVPESRIVAIGNIPVEAFERCGIHAVKNGETLSPKKGEVYVALGVTCGVKDMSGGEFRALNSSKVHIENQSGGEFWACDKSIVHAENQSGGEFWAYDNSKVHAENQSGGSFRARNKSKVHAENQSGGYFRALAYLTQTEAQKLKEEIQRAMQDLTAPAGDEAE